MQANTNYVPISCKFQIHKTLGAHHVNPLEHIYIYLFMYIGIYIYVYIYIYIPILDTRYSPIVCP